MFSRRRSLFDFSRGRLAKGPRRVKRRGDGRGVRLGVELLEDRRMLAVITWANRGDTTGGLNNEGDGFDAAFGAGTAANQARALVDAALFNWSEVITDFNHDAAIGAPPDVELAIQIDSQDNACSAFANGTFDAASGKPTSGSLEINFCDSQPDGVSDWWIDPTPLDNSEFMGPIINGFAGKATPGGPADGMRDLLSLIQHEIGHVMGIGRDATSRLQTGGFLTDTGTFDNGQNDSPNDGTLWVFQGPSINALLTEFDIGSIGTTPGHTARPQGGTDNDGIALGGITVYGSTDTMIGTGITTDQRILLSNKTALILQDAYGYDITLPEQLGTFYAVVDESTGVLTVRGGADNTIIDGVNQGASSDTITITRDGNTIAVSVDVGVDVPGTGTGMNFQDQQDAFVTYFDLGEVSSVVVNAGDGDDLVTIDPLLGVPITVNGEEGNDTIIGGDIIINGGAGDDLIRGSSGNDILNGNEGNDTIYGLDGNDTIDGGADNDIIYAGSGNNTVTSIAGDGDDTIDLSENATEVTFTANGADRLIGTPFNDTFLVNNSAGLFTTRSLSFDGRGGADRLQLQGGNHTNETLAVGATPGGGRSTITSGAGTQTIDFENIEPITTVGVAANFSILGIAGLASLLQDDNQITYLSGQILPNGGRVEIDDFEPIEFENKTTLEIDAGSGDDTIVVNSTNLPTGLQSVVVNGDEGSDAIRFESLPDASSTAFVGATARGGSGDDVIDGSGIDVDTPLNLVGNSGNDTITGGAGADTISGNGDDDTFIDSPGSDSYDGGTGNDTLVFRGTLLNDVIDVFQTAPTTITLSTDLNPAPESTETIVNAGGIPAIEKIRIEALSGDDIIRAGHADAFSDPANAAATPAQTIAFDVIGNGPNASDRLVVPDDGLGDLIIQRQGADQRSGSIVVGGMAPIDYSEIEFVNVTPLDPISAGTGTDNAGRLVVFKNDPFESNNTLPNATFLGSGPTVNVDPTIDPGGIPLFGVPGDNDFYQFVAQETGVLDLQLYFEVIGTLANGRPGLPADGELVATVLDANGVPVSIATATDLEDPNGQKIGERVSVPVVRNNTYFLRVEGQTIGAATGINVYNFTAITTEAPIPELVDLQAASDSGRHNGDDITKITTPTFDIILDDDRIDEFMNINLNPDTVNDDAQTLNDAGAPPIRFDYGVEVFNNAVSIGFAFYTGVGNTWQFTATVGDLNEGDFNHISAAVWIRDAADPAQIGRHELSQSLQITLDTMAPLGFFGLPDTDSTVDGLVASSDTGVLTVPATFADRATSDTTPSLWGRAEADTIVSVYYDQDNDGIIDLDTDILLGQTVATPLDGNLAFPQGYWELTSSLDLNEIVGTRDGIRRLLVTSEDVAGNPMPMDIGAADPTGADVGLEINENVDELYIFIDTQGPQVTNVRTPDDLTYNLFTPKPDQDGFAPLINSLRIDFRDLPNRFDVLAGAENDFLYDALVAGIAVDPGNYLLVGDHVGTIAIDTIALTPSATSNGNPALAFVTLTFSQPLPDDRFTLTVSDNLVDPVGNNLDGESNANEPNNPDFPSGDGVPGGDFVARFTVDSRPEIGSFVAQNIDIDINGNFVWDPANGQIGNDATNVDLTFSMNVAGANGEIIAGGYGVHDLVFAGKFTNGVIPASGRLFDQLAVFGWGTDLNGQPLGKRWLVDTDSDGVINTVAGNDIFTVQPLLANFDVGAAIPIAGDFDGNPANGDEIGLYNAGQWALDTNHDFVIQASEVGAQGDLLGHPIVGNFDGVGGDDFAVFNNNQFFFDLNNDFNSERTLTWGFPGVLDRPVAADFDQDGIDDIGLWVPRNSAQSNRPIAEWYFLLSSTGGAPGFPLDHPFTPVPFGNDLYAEFGDELALPIVGNFDPPVVAEDPTTQNEAETGDFDQDGDVDGSDFLALQRGYGMSGTPSMSDGDGNSDGAVDQYDMQLWSSAYQAGVAATSDFNGDGQVDGGDLAALLANYGTVAIGTTGDADGDGDVDGSDFLRLQRSNQPSTTASVAATFATSTFATSTTASSEFVASLPPALAAAETAAPSVFELLDLSGITSENLAPAAKAAAFEELEEEEFVVEFVDDDKLFSASSLGTKLAGLTVDNALAASEASDQDNDAWESDAWQLAFNEDDLLLFGSI